jgi:anaerobic selenocysteine-containing dehydrogenase
MGFRDKDGHPLPPWTDAESAFEGWKRCSAGRPCDYSGLSYAKLRGAGGIQWPCNTEHPDGTERLYADGTFWAAPDYCEAYGKDLITGAPLEPTEYRAMNPRGKAVIKAAEYLPPHDPQTPEYPFVLITGRTVYHFHTRTKTGRTPQLAQAAPEVWVEISRRDARSLGITEGDPVEVSTPRGSITCAARINGIRDGVLFVPFHYGYWDTDVNRGHHRAANELTVTDWDPVSKQPTFKTAAARARKSPARQAGSVPATAGGAAANIAEIMPAGGRR